LAPVTVQERVFLLLVNSAETTGLNARDLDF